MAAWSSGMILVSGAGGRGFDSRSSPYYFWLIKINPQNSNSKQNEVNKAFIIKIEILIYYKFVGIINRIIIG